MGKLVDSGQYHGEVRRVSTPTPTVYDSGRIDISVALNIEPDGHWERIFNDSVEYDDRVRIARPTRGGHPGVSRSTKTLLGFRLTDADRLSEAVARVDQRIEQANQRYLNEFIPGEVAKAEAARKAAEERAAIQEELDRVAAELVPPGGVEAEVPRGANLPRW